MNISGENKSPAPWSPINKLFPCVTCVKILLWFSNTKASKRLTCERNLLLTMQENGQHSLFTWKEKHWDMLQQLAGIMDKEAGHTEWDSSGLSIVSSQSSHASAGGGLIFIDNSCCLCSLSCSCSVIIIVAVISWSLTLWTHSLLSDLSHFECLHVTGHLHPAAPLALIMSWLVTLCYWHQNFFLSF